jgi:malonyl CoA-acyl carrier protein transacylase
MLVFMFPGQGSQRRGMGQGLFDQVREYAEVEAAVDRLVGYSMRKLCLEDPENKLQQTQYTQPALYVTNALYYFKCVAEGERAALLAGHSLGEYNALFAAGAFDFLTGLRIVCKRGELMAQARNGGMAAVIGLGSGRVVQLIRDRGLSTLDVANYNSPSQTIVSGPLDAIGRAGPIFEQAGAKLDMPLPVSAAFHSRYMQQAAAAFADFLSPFTFAPLKLRVVANATGELYPQGDPSQTIRSLLVRQIAQPVLWTQTIRTLLGYGAASFKEAGPGNVLSRLVQQIREEPTS